jgi:hypothetical protein
MQVNISISKLWSNVGTWVLFFSTLVPLRCGLSESVFALDVFTCRERII